MIPRALRRVAIVARFELADAVRSRRALVVLVLYLAAAMLSCNKFIDLLHRLEAQLAEVLQVPSVSAAGTVSDALWKSKSFRRMMISLVGDREVALGLLSIPPVSLIFGWLSFMYTPLLVLLTTSARVAEEVALGSARFVLVRASRLTWCVGKFVGQAVLVGLALVVSAAGAWCVARYRLAEMDNLLVAQSMLVFAGKAWVFSLAFVGLALGLSQVTRSPNLASAFGFLAWGGLGILAWMANEYAGEGVRGIWYAVELLIPHGHWQDLWRTGAARVVSASVFLVALGGTYLVAGYAVLARRDI